MNQKKTVLEGNFTLLYVYKRYLCVYFTVI